MDTLDLNQVNRFTLQKNHLTEETKCDDLIQITEDLCGLHSTGLTTSYLSLFVRTNNFKKEHLEKELYISKTLGRIRGMRKTLFVQTKNMIPIVFAATISLIEKTLEKYMEYHKISLKEYQEISNQIINLLKGRELSTSAIKKELNSKRLIPEIIHLMCNYGILIRTKPIKDWKDRRNEYALFKDYFPTINLEKVNQKEAIQYLIKKYVKTYGPVSENDISWWTGLTKSKIRDAIKNFEDSLKKVKIISCKGNFLMDNSDMKELQKLTNLDKHTLSLLPELDPYPMGYKERERYIDIHNHNKIFDRSGNIAATIILDGIVIGVWDTEKKPKPTLKFHLFNPIEKDILDELYSKANKIGEFYFDKKIEIKECPSMIPLTERTAGGFMSPLKNC
ncbi:MAG: DNA glycosylase AlkZ-like family protein [Promethearchaeota archaeon]